MASWLYSFRLFLETFDIPSKMQKLKNLNIREQLNRLAHFTSLLTVQSRLVS